MNIQLIEGQFNAHDAIELITQMVYVKVNHHEKKINNSLNEEDIKFWEKKIATLQNDLVEIRKHAASTGIVSLKSTIEMQ